MGSVGGGAALAISCFFLATFPSGASANNRGKHLVGGVGSSHKGGHYVSGSRSRSTYYVDSDEDDPPPSQEPARHTITIQTNPGTAITLDDRVTKKFKSDGTDKSEPTRRTVTIRAREGSHRLAVGELAFQLELTSDVTIFADQNLLRRMGPRVGSYPDEGELATKFPAGWMWKTLKATADHCAESTDKPIKMEAKAGRGFLSVSEPEAPPVFQKCMNWNLDHVDTLGMTATTVAIFTITPTKPPATEKTNDTSLCGGCGSGLGVAFVVLLLVGATGSKKRRRR